MHVLPYTPYFRVEAELKCRCPVWISFPRLCGELRRLVVEIASLLGKVLYVPKERFVGTNYWTSNMHSVGDGEGYA